MNIFKFKKEDGYALLFTLVITSIISIITFGLSNAAYKQILLSSLARDSTIAFYQADIGSECALYADNSDFYNANNTGAIFTCAGRSLTFTKSTSASIMTYSFYPTSVDTNKCFRIDVIKEDMGTYIKTTVNSKGYNICDKSSIRTVERAIEVTY